MAGKIPVTPAKLIETMTTSFPTSPGKSIDADAAREGHAITRLAALRPSRRRYGETPLAILDLRATVKLDRAGRRKLVVR